MTNFFQTKKTKILSQLEVPTDAYTDASPKGSVDEPIRSLVWAINSVDSLVTTSSCSGRIAMYVEGAKVDKASGTNGHAPSEQPGEGGDNAEVSHTETKEQRSSNSQGKGGGAWLFVSHRPVPQLGQTPSTDPTTMDSGTLSRLITSLANEIQSTDGATPVIIADSSSAFPPSARLLHFKFEPLILHILCASIAAAKKVLAAASAAGFRESGASSLPDASDPEVPPNGRISDQAEERKYPRRPRKSQKPKDESVMVAIRTSGLSMDAPIGCIRDDGEIEVCVSDAYVASLLALGNERFVVNEERKHRLLAGIEKAFATG